MYLLLLMPIFYLFLFARKRALKYPVEYKFFMMFYVAVVILFGGTLAPKFREINSVLSLVTDSAFSVGQAILFFAAIQFLIVDWCFSRFESKICSSVNQYFPINRNMILLFWVNCAAFLVVVYSIGVPQENLFIGLSSSEISYIRVTDLHNRNQVNPLIGTLLGYNLSLLLSYYFFFHFLNARSSRNRVSVVTPLFLCTFFIAVYFTTLDLSKSKVIYYFMGIFFIYLNNKYVFSYERIPMKLFFWGGVLFFILILSMFFIVFSGQEIEFIFNYLFSRIFVSQISAYFASVQLVLVEGAIEPNYMDPVHYILEQLRLYDFFAPGQRLTSFIYPEAFYAGRMNYLSTFYGSDLIMSFGWLGLIALVYPFLLLRLFLHYLMRLRDKSISFSLGCFIFLNSNFSSSFYPFVLNISIFLSILLFLLPFCRLKFMR